MVGVVIGGGDMESTDFVVFSGGAWVHPPPYSQLEGKSCRSLVGYHFFLIFCIY